MQTSKNITTFPKEVTIKQIAKKVTSEDESTLQLLHGQTICNIATYMPISHMERFPMAQWL